MVKRKVVNVTPVFDWLCKKGKRINLLKGGAGSSKSYSTAQYLIFEKLCKHTERVILIVRKTLPALKKTAMRLILNLLDEYEIPYVLNKTDLELTCRRNTIFFLSLDDPEKIKSLEVNDIWVEEATELDIDDFRQLRLRMRRKGKKNQMILTFNPIDHRHWLKTEVVDKLDKDIAINHSTHKDNVFLDETYRKEIENLINEDLNYYRIYALGEWGVLENLIYTKWDIIDDRDPRIKKAEEITYGVDWGFNNPSALVRIYWIDDRVIWEELLYEKNLTQEEFVEKVKRVIPQEHKSKEIYVDSSEPALIKALYNAGFNSKEADKDVKAGISYCKAHLIGVTKSSTNLVKELRGYKWKEDKNGNVLDEPVKFEDHALDAARYGTYSHASGKFEILIGRA